MTGSNKVSRDGRLRSSWQVLAVYIGASWVVLQVVDVLKDNMGLPDWVFPFAVALLLIGLPIILATAMIQGRPAAAAPDSGVSESTVPAAGQAPASAGDISPRRLFTWRNALLGGAAAFVLLTAVTTGFMFMRNRGIGPVGSLVAKGVLDERSELVLADFESSDPDLAATATEAFRIDLSQSDLVRVVEPARIAGVLERMEKEPATVDGSLAREVAIREGWPAVIVGDINEAGGRYVLSTRLLSASDGAELLAVRETAADETEIVPAVDRLSSRFRERIGESYSSLRASPALEQVTTGSLDALRLYTQALEADDQGDELRAIGLLEEAVSRDSAFAMAWRKLGTIMNNLGISGAEAAKAQTKAFEHRDRLTARERYLTEGTYYMVIAQDLDRAILAYENLLELDPGDAWALNNVAILYSARGDDEKALEFYQRSIAADSDNTTAYGNAASTLRDLDRPEEAVQVLERALEVAPGAPSMVVRLADLELTRGNFDEATALYESLQDLGGGSPYWRWATESHMAVLEMNRGRFAESEIRRRRAARISDEQGWSGTYLQRESWAAWAYLMAKKDRAAAARILDEALERYPVEAVPDGQAPVLPLANIFAALGRESEAEVLLERHRNADASFATGGWEVALTIMTEAELAVQRGEYDEAIGLLEGMERTVCPACGYLWAGEAADAAGRPEEAIAYFERYVGRPWWVRSIVDGWTLGSVLERLGELYDGQGDLENAAVYYAQFVDLWSEADPDVQPRVETARARLQDIVRERG
jgi:tetratricopeptide (TPR) repeat protein